MVGPMIGRRDEKPFEPAELGNMACMDPELIQQVERRHADKHHQRHTGHRQRQVEDPAQQETGAGLAQGSAEVVVLALVMHRMRGPQDVALMAHAVQPVVAEVIEHKGKHPGPGTLGRQFEQRQVLDGERVGQQAHALGEQACGGGQHSGAEAVDGIRHSVVAHATPTVGQQLDHDQGNKKRYCVRHKVHGLVRSIFVTSRLGAAT